MILDDFENYKSQYEKGAKKISLRSTYPKVDRKTLDFTLEKSFGNYDLFFNHNGVLLHSIHLEKNKSYKVIYGYNQKGILISTMSLLPGKNKLLSVSEFEYDEKGRIKTETDRSFEYDFDEAIITEYIHTYFDNKEEIFMPSNDEIEHDATIYNTYDSKHRLIEEKMIRDEDELLYWYKNEYNSKDEMVKQISLSEKGEPDGVYEFMKVENGLSKGYKFTSKDTNYLRELVYTFNEHGHWINQVLMNDGEPRYFYDRTIEYF